MRPSIARGFIWLNIVGKLSESSIDWMSISTEKEFDLTLANEYGPDATPFTATCKLRELFVTAGVA